MQLGITSIFFNISLCLYYTLVIVYGWRDHQLGKIKRQLFLAPVTVGVGLSLAGIPFYESVVYACHIAPPVRKD